MTIGATHFFPIALAGTGSHTVSASGAVSVTTVKASSGGFVGLGPSITSPTNELVRRYRGIEIAIASDAADNATGSLRVYRAVQIGGKDEYDQKTEYALHLMGTLAFTIGSGVGIAATSVPTTIGASLRFADTFAWTPATKASSPNGISDYVTAGYGSSVSAQEWSPVDNTVAMLLIPDVGNGDIYLDLNQTAGANTKVLVRGTT